jgi:3-hydroxyisobutyrate dehydrogenase-like beta-hydroxyacid dehydrogenase
VSASGHTYGFVGLGNMGAPMAANMVRGGFELLVYDKAGSRERAPSGSTPADSLAQLAQRAQTIFLSVPDGKASMSIARELAGVSAAERATTTVIDLSTIGIEAAKAVHACLAAADMVFIDSPVSGGQAGARAGTITIIWGGPAQILENHRPILRAMSGNIFHVGDLPGQGQAVKLLNNFLSATAMAATTEATLFGLSQGVDLKTILDVVNVSTGRNTATSDKFPNRILSGTFDAGFHSALMSKDVQLYLESVRQAGTPGEIGAIVDHVWREVDTALPGSDLTDIYNYMRDRKKNR